MTNATSSKRQITGETSITRLIPDPVPALMQSPEFSQRMHRMSVTTALLCCLLGALVLIGWLADIDQLKSVLPGLESMKANTALAFLISGLALLVADRGRSSWLSATAGVFVSVLALSTLAQHLLNLSIGVDEWLISDPAGELSPGAPGRMSPGTALMFAASGLAIAAMAMNRLVLLAQLLALSALCIAAIGLIGYFFGAVRLQVVTPFTSMALHSAIGGLLLGSGVIALRAGSGFVQPLLANTTSVMIYRGLLPLAIIIPVSIGTALVVAERMQLLNPTMALATSTVLTAALLIVLILRSAVSVSRQELNIAAERNYVETALASIGDAVIMTNSAGEITFLNACAEELTEWPPAEAIGMQLSEVFVTIDDSSPTVVDPSDSKGEQLTDLVDDRILTQRSGTRLHINYSKSTISSSLGKNLGIVVVFRDVTPQRDAAVQLAQTQSRLADALDAGRLGEWRLNLETRRADTNRRHDQIFGYSDGVRSWTFETFQQHVYPDDRARITEAFERSLATGRDWNFETRIVRSDGVVRWIWGRGRSGTSSDTTLTSSEADNQYMSGVVQDITRRKSFEEANKFLAAIAEPLSVLDEPASIVAEVATLSVGFLADWSVIDLRSETGVYKRAASAHAKPSAQKLVANLTFDYSSNSNNLLASVAASGQPQLINDFSDAALQRLSPNSEQLERLRSLTPVAMLAVPLTSRGQSIGVMAFFFSDSGRRYSSDHQAVANEFAQRISVAIENAQLYATLQREDERKNLFLAMLAHELRNPLGAINNGLALIEPEAKSESSKSALAMMQRQRQQLTHLLDDLLDISRISQGRLTLEPRAIAIEPIVDGAIAATQSLRDGKKQSLVIELINTDVYVMADRVRFEQVLTNLLTNAAKYTPEEGAVDVSVRSDEQWAYVSISDNGIGLRDEDLDRVFELFEQINATKIRSTDGLGLGLSLVREIMELHGGKVDASSKGLGYGSTFTISIPLAASTSAEPAPCETVKADGNEPQRIMLIDDNADSIEALAEILRIDEHAVELAFTGGSALSNIMKFGPDIVLLDIGLPDMDGYEVAKHIRAMPGGRDVLLLAVTGFGQPEDRERSHAAGFDQHLVKPLELSELQNILAHRKARQG